MDTYIKLPVLSRFILTITAISLLSASCLGKIQAPSGSPYQTPLVVDGRKIFVEIANTPKALENGLSGREELTNSQGMLFDFSETSQTNPGFWMKDMKFNLDIIWIWDNKIIGIEHNVPALKTGFENLPIYYPPSTIDKVLEVKGGFTDIFGIKVGGKVELE